MTYQNNTRSPEKAEDPIAPPLSDVEKKGIALAGHATVSWPPLKVYNNSVVVGQSANKSDQVESELATLRAQNDVLWKVIVRLRGEIRFQIRFWEDGFQHGEWKTASAMKRQLSRLKGALQYMREFYPNRRLDDENP